MSEIIFTNFFAILRGLRDIAMGKNLGSLSLCGYSFICVLLTKAILLLSGDHEGVLIEP